MYALNESDLQAVWCVCVCRYICVRACGHQRKRLTCMDEHVSAQVVGAAEGCVAVLTDVRLGVRGHWTPFPIQHQ